MVRECEFMDLCVRTIWGGNEIYDITIKQGQGGN